MNKDLVRTNVNLPKSMRDRIDNYAEEIGINLTSAIIILLKTGLDNNDIIKSMKLSKEECKD